MQECNVSVITNVLGDTTKSPTESNKNISVVGMAMPSKIMATNMKTLSMLSSKQYAPELDTGGNLTDSK